MAEIHDVALTAAEFDFRLRVYPAPEPTGGVLVWLHGGAFMFGTLDMPEADQVGRRLSAAGTTVVSVDYTLAPLDALDALGPPEPREGMPTPEQMKAEMDAAGPRAAYPVASLQTVAAFDWAVQNAGRFGGSPGRVALGGASAGGNLAAGAGVRLRDRASADGAAAVPSALALVYPVLHAPLPPASEELVALLAGLPHSLTFPPESTDAINRNYLGGGDPRQAHAIEPYAFPGGHDMTGLAPTLIVTADRDRLRASGEAFAAELALAGVDVRLVRLRGALHGFLNELGDPAAEATLALLADAVAGAPAALTPALSVR
ncbi:alpha/beta hydrolase fold domain-containing protein [Micromonospora sp. DT81.3]|uniref:alpha/beta hydrolase fold domain-containing protein n=1 Tax=Actinomycetes TaxID=1760 RepID=UPI003CE797BC